LKASAPVAMRRARRPVKPCRSMNGSDQSPKRKLRQRKQARPSSPVKVLA
jgi:hypothetical protein